MFYSLTSDEHKIHARNARKGAEYFCPICRSQLILRNGIVKSAHFAHAKNTQCTDTWNYDGSDFKASWLTFFEDDEREVVLQNEKGIKHIADVIANNCILEIQGSKINMSEFDERNYFFSEFPYKVAWLINEVEAFEDKSITVNEANGTGVWTSDYRHLKHLLSEANYPKNVSIFVQLGERQLEDKVQPVIIKLQNVVFKEDGIHFSYGHELGLAEFLDTYYSDFAISNKAIKTLENDGDSNTDNEFADTLASGFDGNQPPAEKSSETDATKKKEKGHSITYLWKMNYRVAIFRNLRTNMKVKIFDDQAERALKSRERKWYGSIKGQDRSSYSRSTFEIYGSELDEWKVEWFVTHQDAMY